MPNQRLPSEPQLPPVAAMPTVREPRSLNKTIVIILVIFIIVMLLAVAGGMYWIKFLAFANVGDTSRPSAIANISPPPASYLVAADSFLDDASPLTLGNSELYASTDGKNIVYYFRRDNGDAQVFANG